MTPITSLVVPMQSGRFVVADVSIHGQMTAVSDHLLERTAVAEARERDARWQALNAAPVVLPPLAEDRQIPMGFYTDEDAR